MGDFCCTFTGRSMHFLGCDPDEISIIDIAHALSLQCRFNGHCLQFYSVAQHCVHVSQQLPEVYKLTGLLHDAAEAYIGDVITPFKERYPKIQEVEGALLGRVMGEFGGIYPLPTEVVEADQRMLATEVRDLLTSSSAQYFSDLPSAYPIPISNSWAPLVAEQEFLNWFYWLYRREQGACNASV